jgi:hypothetical protein
MMLAQKIAASSDTLMNCACDFMGFNGIATDAHSPISTHIAM